MSLPLHASSPFPVRLSRMDGIRQIDGEPFADLALTRFAQWGRL
jgi:hypothetical protein